MVALQGAGGNADQQADQGQGHGEQNRYPRAEYHPRQHITALVIGAQPIDRGRRAGCGLLQVVVGCVGTERNRREQHPAALVADQLLHILAAVVRLERQLAAKGLLGVALERREIQLPLIAHEQWFVVGHQLGTQAQHQQHGKQPQRDPATAVAPKALQASA
ncbi:hypothetical protein D9M71_472410 [compost metagenome]